MNQDPWPAPDIDDTAFEGLLTEAEETEPVNLETHAVIGQEYYRCAKDGQFMGCGGHAHE